MRKIFEKLKRMPTRRIEQQRFVKIARNFRELLREIKHHGPFFILKYPPYKKMCFPEFPPLPVRKKGKNR